PGPPRAPRRTTPPDLHTRPDDTHWRSAPPRHPPVLRVRSDGARWRSARVRYPPVFSVRSDGVRWRSARCAASARISSGWCVRRCLRAVDSPR
ncbi:hypothetical protein, partial [Streptomyces sp. WM6386]|uniref:hypothetical protein n=1 Tax=Streptomyces sp. WM6386 TaxID=1415558 RepID=UPI000AE96B03